MHWYWHDLSWDISCPFLQICTKIWFHRILYMHLYWQDLAWDCFTSFFPNLYQSYCPWFTPKVCCRSISWEQMDRISPNFKYALILTTSILGSVHVIFLQFFTRVMTLDLRQNCVSAQYLENKLTEFHQALNMHSYWQNLVYYRVMPLYWCQNLFLLKIFRFSCLVSLELAFLLHEKRCIGATPRFSDNSSFTWIYKIFFTLHVFKPFCSFAWLKILDENHRVTLTHPFALHRNPYVPVFKCSLSS